MQVDQGRSNTMETRLSLTTAAAVLALVAPTVALAGASPDDRAMPRGTTFSDAGQPSGMSPDDRALPRSTTVTVASKNVVVSPDDRSFSRSVPVARPIFVRVSNGGFDWTDAGVGAASGFGIAIVLLGAGMIFLRRGSGRPVAA
jgi:hypothetical protein